MTALKGFTEAFEEPGKDADAIPRPGTQAHLRYVEQEKKRKKAESKKARAVVPEPVDNLPVDNSQPTSQNEGASQTEAQAQPTSKTEGASQNEGAELEAGEVRIERNYMRLDMDIFGALIDMTGAEAKIYLDFIRRTYGQLPPRNICSCTNRMLAEATGVTAPATQSKALDSLERKGLLKRLVVARKCNEKSMYRVTLPCELPGAKSRTTIRFKN